VQIAVARFPRVAALDVIGPYEVLQRLPELLVDTDAAKAMQLMVEYDPQPPFDGGSPEKAGDAVLARVVGYAAEKD